MATSRSATRSFFVGGTFAFLITSASCAQVTGLSDDYRYDLAGDGSTSTTNAEAGAGDAGDGSTSDARLQCSASDRSRAGTEISNAGGDSLSGPCRQCLATTCCAPIDTCANNSECQAVMKCTFSCLKENGSATAKAQCIDNCRPGPLFQAVTTCAHASCASTCPF
jgi:hypothetical protein